ncbi:MAG: hypothetical protein KBS86_02460 [Proteobacteria bacterium]|nr:hypothetical protein [Candidatus Enterousia scatequi]
MRKHIFTLGIILTIIPAYGYRSRDANNIWTDPERTTLAKEICDSDTQGCPSASCWLPGGIYYDNKGTFTETCTGGCSSGRYNIGFSSCVDVKTNGTGRGYITRGREYTADTGTYGLTEDQTWGVTFSGYGQVKGISACTSTSGTLGVATDTEFSNTTLTGGNCWCKMTSPATSRWVFYAADSGSGSCGRWCAYHCADVVQNNVIVRSGMFRLFGSESSFDQTYARKLRDCSRFSCPPGQYDLGFSSCIENVWGSGWGGWNFNGGKSSATTYGLTAAGQWGTTLDGGNNITGIASCNDTPGTQGVLADTEFSNTVSGEYCWCKMTSPAASSWAYLYDYTTNSSSTCAEDCAGYCGRYSQSTSSFRSAMFWSVGN